MLDYQRIIDDVRNSLYATGDEASETIRAAAAAYTVASQEVGERLRRCGELLNAGLRSEALQQAEIEPNLLDVVAALDFPERELWTQLVQQFGIMPPGPLPLDIAADLNEAYAIEQPMVALLAKHRLLALARSPLRQRIRTLREIAETDSNNPVWQDDLHLYEQERLKQIQREAGDCLENGDLETARSLVEELQDTPWTESPADALFDRLSGTLRKLIARNAIQELDTIDLEMNAAYSAFEIEKMRSLRNRWTEFLPQAGVGGSAPVCQRIAPALEWLANYDRKDKQRQDYVAALAALEEALEDDDTTSTQLERRYRAATKHGDEVPEALDRRVKARLEAIALAAQRKFRLWVGTASLALCTVAIVIGFVIYRQMHSAQVGSHSMALAKLLDESRLDEAQKYVARLNQESPRVAGTAEVQSLVSRLSTLTQQDESRRKNLESLLAQSRTLLEEVRDWPAQNDATSLLGDAEKLARTDAEKADVKRLQLELAEKTRELQRREDAAFTPPFDALTDKVRRLEVDNTNTPARETEIRRLRKEIADLQSRGKHASVALYDQTKPLLARLDALAEDIKSFERQQSAAFAVTAEVGNEAGFLKAIETYIKQYPDSARSADFRRLAEEAPLWQSLAKYSALAESWTKSSHTSIGAQAAKSQIDAANALFKEAPDFSIASEFQARLPYLEAIARRGTSLDSLSVKLQASYSKPWIADLFMIQLLNSDRYYVKLRPQSADEQGVARVKYVIDFDLTEKSFPATKRGQVAKVESSPQAIWATGARKQLVGLLDERWESTMYNLLQSIYANQDIDALPRLTLIRQTLDVASQGSLPFERAFKSQIAAVNDPSIDPFANWLDPEDQKAAVARNKAVTVLNEIPDMKVAARAAAQDWQALRQPVGKRFDWVGWLSRGSDGRWECAHSRPSAGAGDLVVVFKSAADGKPRVEKIGTLQNGEYQISSQSGEPMLEGRLIFLAAPLAEIAASSSR